MQIRRIALLAVPLVLLAMLAIPARATGEKNFTADLIGYNEVPAISTTGAGEFSARLSNDETELTYELSYAGLSGPPSGAHIHLGQKDVNGGVIAFLCGGGGKPPCPPSGTVTGTITAADIVGPAGQGIAAGELSEAVDALRAGVVYANVHTENHSGGEIRGQVR